MNKYILFGLLMLWLLFATYLVNAFDSYLDDDTFGVDNPIGDIGDEGDNNFETANNFARTLINAIFFQVNGLPFVVSLIFFTTPSFILAFMTLDMLIALINAILPF